MFEKIFFLARQKIKFGPFLESSELMNPIGCNSEQLSDLLSFCGFESIIVSSDRRLFFYANNNLKKQNIKKKTPKKVKIKSQKEKKIINKKIADPNSPFAVLQKLL